MTPSLTFLFNGKEFLNPFWAASGPETDDYDCGCELFDAGWGGLVWKTVTDQGGIINTQPCLYARTLPDRQGKAGVRELYNNQLISTRILDDNLHDVWRLKANYGDRAIGLSLMEPNLKTWQTTAIKCQDAGADFLELNFGCPHGMTERKQGSATGQVPELCREISAWVQDCATIPVIAKMTPNVTDITAPGRASLQAGIFGLSAVNTYQVLMGVDKKTLRPRPTVKGYACKGGGAGWAIRSLALSAGESLAKMIAAEFPEAFFSHMGGIETADDVIDSILYGADSIQVCTAIMMLGASIVQPIAQGVLEFMDYHGFERVSDFKGLSLPYVTTQTHLVELQFPERAASIVVPAAANDARSIVAKSKALMAQVPESGTDEDHSHVD